MMAIWAAAELGFFEYLEKSPMLQARAAKAIRQLQGMKRLEEIAY